MKCAVPSHGRRHRLLAVASLLALPALLAPKHIAYVPPSEEMLKVKGNMRSWSPELTARAAEVREAFEDRILGLKDALDLQRMGAIIADVRTRPQIMRFSKGRTIKQAIVTPMDGWLERDAPPSCFEGRRVILACTDGDKSMLALEFLREHEVDAYVLDGGQEEWEANMLPTQLVYLGSGRSA
eukprot:TRINITY_DN27057_c0_g1_i2.p1 TRINITY_DN27057_c0_g1~~TRINITY_DN27057_c0_g1_i2.p1  ORF type:complete len:195 (+),score=31.95 TRINITY_DN27057_c0_g1_i2:39-587(+)